MQKLLYIYIPEHRLLSIRCFSKVVLFSFVSNFAFITLYCPQTGTIVDKSDSSRQYTFKGQWMLIGRYLQGIVDADWSIPSRTNGCRLVDTFKGQWMLIGRYLQGIVDADWSIPSRASRCRLVDTLKGEQMPIGRH